MNAYTIRSGSTVFKRISKQTARRLWAHKNVNIALCPVKLRPGFPWAPHCTYLAGEQAERPFDQVVNAFTYYNCPDNETGTYAAFYLVGEIAP